MIQFNGLSQPMVRPRAEQKPQPPVFSGVSSSRDTVKFSGQMSGRKSPVPRFGDAPTAGNRYGLDDMTKQMSDVLKDFLENKYRKTGYNDMLANLKDVPKTPDGKVDFVRKFGPVIKAHTGLAQELGILGVDVPEEYGGLGLKTLTQSEIARNLGYEDAGLATTVLVSTGTGLFGKPILVHGTEEQKMTYLPEIINGEKIGAFALTEPDSGSDAGAMRTKATRIDGKWVLDGEKTFITNGHIADYFVVLAKTVDVEKGIGINKPVISAFIVHKDDLSAGPGKGVDTQDIDKMGQHTSDTAIVKFNDVVLDDSRLIGGEAGIGIGKDIYNKTLVGGRIGVSAMATGTAERGLDAAVDYAKTRIQFKTPIAEKKLIRNKLAQMAVNTEVSRLLAYSAARLKDRSDEAVAQSEKFIPFTKEASFAKLFATEKGLETLKEAIQIHGGNGYTSEYVPAKLYQDARVFSIYEGTSEIQQLIIARELLGELTQKPEALEHYKALLRTPARNLPELVERAYAQALLAVADSFMSELGKQDGNMGKVFDGLQDQLGDVAWLATKRAGLKALGRQVKALNEAGLEATREKAMFAVFADEVAWDAVKTATALSGETTLLRSTLSQKLLAESGRNAAEAREVVARQLLA